MELNRRIALYGIAVGVIFGLLALGLVHRSLFAATPAANRILDPEYVKGLCEPANPKPPKLNPYTRNPQAIAQGKALWEKVGCYGCHGRGGGGGMGPSLISGRWRYGGSDACMFTSIYFGRPKGMPAWGKLGKLKPDEIWKVMAYVRSLYKGDPNLAVW
jgi:cytochrome c(L)